MRRDLSFLKVSDYSFPFREIRGHDDELYLNDSEIESVTTGAGVYIIVSEDKTKFVYPKGISPVIYRKGRQFTTKIERTLIAPE